MLRFVFYNFDGVHRPGLQVHAFYHLTKGPLAEELEYLVPHPRRRGDHLVLGQHVLTVEAQFHLVVLVLVALLDDVIEARLVVLYLLKHLLLGSLVLLDFVVSLCHVFGHLDQTVSCF